MKDYTYAKSLSEQAQKESTRANSVLEAVLTAYQNTPHARAKAQAKVQERKERMQEREIQLGWNMGRSR